MQIQFTFKNFDPSEHLKKYAATRFEKLFKYSRTENASLQVNLSVDRFRHMAEVIFSGDDLHLSAFEESEDMYSTVDLVLDKMAAQVRKNREKARDNRRKGSAVSVDATPFIPEEEEDTTPAIIESESYEIKPMSVDEAAMQLTSLNYEFLVFFNAETRRINVIYRLKNNKDFGLIDPKM